MIKKNRLATEISPYLQQHADNPVDWFPWGKEAINKAVNEDKPIFLSIGYSSCHWCHVMERESFENPEIAKILNKNYISVKVDREERPDLDDIYMDAVQLIAGNGGWPMSVFLDTQLRPFFGGTYFPPESRYGRKGFREILEDIAVIWRTDRKTIESSTIEVFKSMSRETSSANSLDRNAFKEIETHACNAYAASFDAVNGGFGDAPKFPPSLPLQLMLEFEKRTGNETCKHIVIKTLDAMASGGIYDHIGGGFCRYAVDKHWRVPHFEKMLYDNAQLATNYLQAYMLYKNKTYLQIALETLGYILRDMRDSKGGFYSAQDADSEGKEGVFYLWTADELRMILKTESDHFFKKFNIQQNGNFQSHEICHEGLNILYSTTPDKTAKEKKMLNKLNQYRRKRAIPFIDDKVIVSWNSLMISALAKSTVVTGQNKWLEAAERAADFIGETMYKGGQLYRIYRQGVIKQEAMLEDWALFGNACIDLYEAGGNDRWLQLAMKMAENTANRFEDRGVFYLTECEAEHVIIRKQSLWDSVIPSGTSAAARLYYRFGKIQNDSEWIAKVESIMLAHARILLRAPGSMSVLAGTAGCLT